MEALLFGDRTEILDVVTHNNVALFEQYEPLVAVNDEAVSGPADDLWETENLYLVPNW